MPEVQGPDGQRYQFPDGTSPDVMKQAMARRYPKSPAPEPKPEPVSSRTGDPLSDAADPNMPPNVYEGPSQGVQSTYNQRIVEGLSDPSVWRDNVSAAVSGANNLLYASLDDEIAGFLGDKTGFKPLQGYESEQDRLRAERPFMFQGGQMVAGMVPTTGAMAATQSNSIVKNAAAAGTTNAAIGLPHGYNDADAEGESRLSSGLVSGGVGGAFGAVLGGGGAALGKRAARLSSSELQAAAADIAVLDDGPIRPQAVKAFNRLLAKSGLSDADIARVHGEVRNRQASLQGLPASAQSRKRAFQHYMEVLADDEGSALYHPQAAANILMTVQERANNARPGDASRGIVGAAVKADRASQVPFLEDSAQNVATGSRVGTADLVETTRKQLGAQYDEVLDPSQISGQGQLAAREMIESIRPLLDGQSGLKVQAAAEGVPIDELIERNPMRALHWIQSAARRKAQSSDPNRAAYAALRARALPVIESNVPDYRNLRRNYASNEGLDNAKEFGDKLFGGSNNQAIQNPGMRAELVRDFNKLTDLEKQAALVSIRDKALGRMTGGADEAPARLASMNDRNVLDFLEQIGQKGFADDIRAIGRENQLLSVADSGNPLRQSATFSNAQSRAEAPALYNSKIANAVDNSTPGTMLGEGMLMAFAPHYQGAYAAYRGGRMMAAAGLGTRKKTLEDMTRFLMARNDAPEPKGPKNAFTAGQEPSRSTPKGNAFMGTAGADAAALTAVAAGTAGTADAQEIDYSAKLQEADTSVKSLEAELSDLDAEFSRISSPDMPPEDKQIMLKNMGLYSGPIDGDIGEGSRAAIQQAQSMIEAQQMQKRKDLEAARASLNDIKMAQVYDETQSSPYGPWVQKAAQGAGVLGGLYLGKRFRSGAVKKSAFEADKVTKRANAFITTNADGAVKPISGAKAGPNSLAERAGNMNQLYREGGATDAYPFRPKARGGEWATRAKPAEAHTLYPEPQRFNSKDQVFTGVAAADAAAFEFMRSEEQEKLEDARARVQQFQGNPDKIADYKKALEDEKRSEAFVNIYTTLSRVGAGAAVGRVMGARSQPYARPKPELGKVETEVGMIRQQIAKNRAAGN